MKKTPSVLCCGGLDPSGGAGILADIRAVESQGIKCQIALTANTVQSDTRFSASYPVPADQFEETACLLMENYPLPVVKTGMLPTVAIVEKIIEMKTSGLFQTLVVDPVIITSSGGRLIDEEAEALISRKLLPLTTVLTPNIREAEKLTGLEIKDTTAMCKAGRLLLTMGPENVVMKGGHLEGEAIDFLIHASGTHEFRGPRYPGIARGTGCSFASVIAASLAKSQDIKTAVSQAKEYISSLFHK